MTMNMNIPPAIFITGTDTDIGKTYISKLLADSISNYRSVTYFKPVQTGCVTDTTGDLIAPDFEYVKSGGTIKFGLPSDHVPYRFTLACSPHFAAMKSGITISLEPIQKAYDHLSQQGHVMIVEGAGGILTPLTDKISMLDLMARLSLPVVLVTSPRIGTLNHTFLTIDALFKNGLSLAGIVINNLNAIERNDIYADNVKMIHGRAPSAALLDIDHEKINPQQIMEFVNALGL